MKSLMILGFKASSKYLRSLFTHKGFKRYLVNTYWFLIEKILHFISSFIIGVWIARYLGPEQYGILSYAQAFIGLFSALASLGLDNILVRELVNNPKYEGKILGTALGLKFIGSILTLIVVFLIINLFLSDDLIKLIVFILSISIVFRSFDVIELYFQAKVQAKYITFARIISLLIGSLLKMYLIFVHASLIFFAIAIVFDSLVLSLGYAWWFIKIKQMEILRKLKFTLPQAVAFIKDSWPLIFSGIAITIYMRIDQIMIKEILGVKDLGIYSAAVKLTDIWLFLTVIITNSLFPAIINAKKKSQELYENRIINLYRLLFLLSLSISVIVYIFSQKVVFYTYGKEYIESADVLRIYIWSIIFVFLNNGSWKWYVIENLQKLAIIRFLIGACVNIILNLWLIKEYGVLGAAYATLISYGIAAYLGNLFFKRTILNFKLQTKAILTFYKLQRVW